MVSLLPTGNRLVVVRFIARSNTISKSFYCIDRTLGHRKLTAYATRVHRLTAYATISIRNGITLPNE